MKFSMPNRSKLLLQKFLIFLCMNVIFILLIWLILTNALVEDILDFLLSILIIDFVVFFKVLSGSSSFSLDFWFFYIDKLFCLINMHKRQHIFKRNLMRVILIVSVISLIVFLNSILIFWKYSPLLKCLIVIISLTFIIIDFCRSIELKLFIGNFIINLLSNPFQISVSNFIFVHLFCNFYIIIFR